MCLVCVEEQYFLQDETDVVVVVVAVFEKHFLRHVILLRPPIILIDATDGQY
jgi:hypothetical protein